MGMKYSPKELMIAQLCGSLEKKSMNKNFNNSKIIK